MSRLYPVMLDLAGARVLVVGGGEVAARRVVGLLDAGARVTVIAPEMHAELEARAGSSDLTLIRRALEAGDVAGHRVVMAATGRREVNETVAREGAAAGAWVSVVDDPDSSSFQVPALIRSGEVTVAVSTGGASPLLAGLLRDRLDGVVTPGLGRASVRLHELRARVRERWPADAGRRRAFWSALIDDEFLDRAIDGRDEELEKRIEACLSQS